MVKAYSCTFKTPEGNQEFEADSWGSLVSMALSEVSRIIAVNVPFDTEDPLEASAKTMLDAYQRRFVLHSNRPRSPIATASLEIDIIKCYLQGLHINETVEWLKKHKDFQTSITAVGRYWRKFYTLGFVPGKY